MSDAYIHLNHLPWVRETPFKEIYLPLLLNMKTQEDRDRWLTDVAVSLYTRVNVVADDDEENILFYVPPLKYTPPTTVGGNLMAIAQHYETVNTNYGPKHANRYYDQVLGGQFVQPDPPKEDVDQWKMILGRYGYVELTEETPQETGNGGITSVAEDW